LSHYSVGQLVQHRHYGYRGVIVEYDEQCRAEDGWYYSNRTQPERDQSWYHVLVHGRMHSTYAAEENLAPDTGGEQVIHPLIDRYFTAFRNGAYVPAV